MFHRGEQQGILGQQGQKRRRWRPLAGGGQSVVEGHGEPRHLSLLAEGQHRCTGSSGGPLVLVLILGRQEPAELFQREGLAALLGVPVVSGVPGVKIGDRPLCRVQPFP